MLGRDTVSRWYLWRGSSNSNSFFASSLRSVLESLADKQWRSSMKLQCYAGGNAERSRHDIGHSTSAYVIHCWIPGHWPRESVNDCKDSALTDCDLCLRGENVNVKRVAIMSVQNRVYRGTVSTVGFLPALASEVDWRDQCTDCKDLARSSSTGILQSLIVVRECSKSLCTTIHWR